MLLGKTVDFLQNGSGANKLAAGRQGAEFVKGACREADGGMLKDVAVMAGQVLKAAVDSASAGQMKLFVLPVCLKSRRA